MRTVYYQNKQKLLPCLIKRKRKSLTGLLKKIKRSDIVVNHKKKKKLVRCEKCLIKTLSTILFIMKKCLV